MDGVAGKEKRGREGERAGKPQTPAQEQVVQHAHQRVESHVGDVEPGRALQPVQGPVPPEGQHREGTIGLVGVRVGEGKPPEIIGEHGR